MTRVSLELSDQNHQADIELTLLQMRAGMVTHIDQALARLETGQADPALNAEPRFRNHGCLCRLRSVASRAKAHAKTTPVVEAAGGQTGTPH